MECAYRICEEDTDPTTKGRALVAARDLVPGELIVGSVQPVAHVVVLASRSARTCARCLRVCARVQRCGACRAVAYCSVACQRADWTALHRAECAGLARLLPHVATPLLLLLTRLVRAALAVPDIRELLNSLRLHETKQSEDRAIYFGQLAHMCARVLDFDFAAPPIPLAEIAHLCAKLSTNAFHVLDDDFTPLGLALYPTLFLANHSCVPNAVVVFEGAAASLRALAPVPAGTELHVAYVDVAASTHERRHQLQSTYHFLCRCPRCLDSEFDLAWTETGSDAELSALDALEQEARHAWSRAKLDEATDRLAALHAQLTRLKPDGRSYRWLRYWDVCAEVAVAQQDWPRGLAALRALVPLLAAALPALSPVSARKRLALAKLAWLLGEVEEARAAVVAALETLERVAPTATTTQDALTLLTDLRAHAAAPSQQVKDDED